MALATARPLAIGAQSISSEEDGSVRGTMKLAAVAAMTALLSACGGGEKAAETETATDTGAVADPSIPASALAQAPAAFAQCRSCHSVQPGQHGVGPSLFGIYGTKAGDLPGYVFSDALKASGLTWDDATLDRWLESPAKTVPGTKMVFFGLPDAGKRKEVIEYLKSLK